MTNNELSELEIKLINASRKFAEEQNKKIGCNRYSVKLCGMPFNRMAVCIEGPYTFNKVDWDYHGRLRPIECNERVSLVSANYEEGANNGEINIGRLKGEEDIINFQKTYISFLTKEIPEIKERIKYIIE